MCFCTFKTLALRISNALQTLAQHNFLVSLAHCEALEILVQDLMHANTSIWCVFCTCKALALTNLKYFAHHTTYFFAFLAYCGEALQIWFKI
jgi:hypothetical protein